MWYIAVSLVLYIITPPVYYWISRAYVNRLLLIITGVIALNYGVEYVSEEYWSKISIGLKYAHMYFWGMLTAYLAKNKSLPQELIVTAAAVLTMAYVASLFCNVTHIVYFETLVTTLFYIALLICVLQLLDYQKIGSLSVCLSWFGKYSLELYLLHIFLDALFTSPLFHLTHAQSIVLAVFTSIIICAPLQAVVNKTLFKLQKI